MFLGRVTVISIALVAFGALFINVSEHLSNGQPSIPPTPTFSSNLTVISSTNAAQIKEVAFLMDKSPAWVFDLAFSPDNKILATVGDFGLRFWDMNTGIKLNEFQTEGTPYSLAFSPDGATFAASSDSDILVWDTTHVLSNPHPTPKMILLGHRGYVYSLAISPDSKTMVSSGDSVLGEKSTIRLWDLATGRQTALIQIAECQIRTPKVTFSPDDQTIAASDCQGGVFIWDIVKQQKVLELPGDNPVTFSHDGALLAYQDGLANERFVRLWDIKAGKERLTLRGGSYSPADWIQSAAFSPDDTLFAAGSYDQAGITIWDVKTGKLLIVTGIGGETSLQFSPDGTRLASGHASAAGVRSDVHIWGVNQHIPSPAFSK